jgi:3-hydroxyisobutyrate dehydrogenase-like beta-hydroxyacid dehydrogenase
MPDPVIGWIGLGRIGLPMAERVANAGERLQLWARRPEIARSCTLPAVWSASAEELASRCDVVVTVLGTSEDVVEVQRRMLPHARPGALFVDMTTAAPAIAAELDAECASRGVARLDAPVTGGVAGARAGRLSVLVGGGASDLARARPLLECLGEHIVHCGKAGTGYRMKLVNQVAMVATLLGLAQAARLASASGFDAPLVIEALGAGTASGLLFDSYMPRLMPPGGPITFTVGMLRKDLRLARDEALALGSDLDFLDFALMRVDEACARFGTGAGVQSLAQVGTDRGASG